MIYIALVGVDDGYYHGPLGSEALTATRCGNRSSLGGDVPFTIP